MSIIANPHDLYRFLIGSVRKEDESEVLLRYLAQPQVLFDDWYDYATVKLRALTDPENAQLRDSEGGYLPYLAWLVGFDPSFFELTRRMFGASGTDLDAVLDYFWVPAFIQAGAISTSATFSLEFLTYLATYDPRTLKKLIKLGVPLWKNKGVNVGVRDIATLMTGQEPFIRDWFYHRFILDETAFGDYAFFMDSTVGVGVDAPEYQVDIRVEKPDTAEEVVLILQLLAHHRGLSERYNVAFVDFLDNFRDGVINRWSTVLFGVSTGTISEDEFTLNTFTLQKRDCIKLFSTAGGAGVYPTDGVQLVTDHPLQSDWVANRTLIFRASFQDKSPGISAGFTVNNGKGTAKTAEVFFQYVPFDGLPGAASIDILPSGGAVITTITTPFDLVHGIDYVFRIDFIVNADGSGFVRVYIDGDFIGACPAQAAATFVNETNESFSIYDSANGAVLTIDDVELFQHPLTVVRVGLHN